MPVLKKSVAFDEAVGLEALDQAGERGFSRFVNESVAQRLQAIRIQELLNEFESEHGRVSEAIQQAVEVEWAGASQAVDLAARRG
jgi:hypothetical protein